MIVDPDFCDHWKTRMLVGLLDGDEAAPVYVLRIWAHCQHRKQGQFDKLPPEALKALCRFPGHSNKLEASLATSGFIRREGDAVVVVNWDEYNAGLIAAWNNGSKGGRPPKKKPLNNPSITQEKPRGLRGDESRGDETEERENSALAVKGLEDGYFLPDKFSDETTKEKIREYVEFCGRIDPHGRKLDQVALRERLAKCGDWTADRLRRSIDLSMSLMRNDKILDDDKPPPKHTRAPKEQQPLKDAKPIV